MGVFVRGSKLWIRFRGVDGRWRNTRTGYDVGQETLAEEMLGEVLRRVRKELAGEAPSDVGELGAITVRAFAETWLEERRALDLDWTNDRGRLENHVFPRIGDMPIASVRTRHLIELFRWRRTTPLEATGELPSQRLVYNIYSVVSALFRDAKLAERIASSPCELDDRHLGPFVDKDPEWRAGAVFSRDEVQTIIADERIPFDRRVVYALEFLAGVRYGEAAGLRWRHYDPQLEPLGKLLVARSYNTRKHREKATKTNAERHVPVHPTLAAMLAEWKLHGWESMVGRAPVADDLIVPLPPDVADRRRTRKGEPFRSHDWSGKRWREDLPMLGLRHRRGHDARATFITLALEDGADPHVIETRVTHTKRSRTAFDGYVRSRQWALVCAEVAKLKISRVAKVVEVVPLAVGESSATCGVIGAGTSLVTSAVTAVASGEDSGGKEWRRRESNPRPQMLLTERLRV